MRAVGFAGTAVWLNVTGEPLKPATVAWAACAPAVAPSTRSAAASPSASVSTVTGEIEPPPVTLQLTSTPATGLPSWSVVFTTSESESAEFTGPVWSSPETPASTLPLPAMAVAWKDTSRLVVAPPRRVCTRRSWSPTLGPSVQAAAALPAEFVFVVAGVTVPPPLPMLKLTS